MSCRRAFDIDLPAYLADPRASEFEAFRAHYPRCAACSAEVRAWTELEHSLRAVTAHPDPELLVRYDGGDLALGSAERSGLEAHLAGCAVCRDELRALGGFAQPLAAAPGVSEPGAWQRLLAGLRGLVWQPAFAYALLAVVAVPTLYRTIGPGGNVADEVASVVRESPRSESRRSEPASQRAPEAVPKEATLPAAAPPAPPADSALPARVRSEAAAPPPAAPPPARRQEGKAEAAEPATNAPRQSAPGPRPVPSAVVEPVPDVDPRPAVAEERAEVQAKSEPRLDAFAREIAPGSPTAAPALDAPHPAPGGLAQAPGADAREADLADDASAPAVQLEEREAEPLRALGYAFSEEPEREAASGDEAAAPGIAGGLGSEAQGMRARKFSQGRLAATQAGSPSHSLRLEPDASIELPLQAAELPLRLGVPLPAGPGARVDLTLRGPEGREWVERHRLEPDTQAAWLELPPGWLAPGAYRLEIESPDRETVRIDFSVRPHAPVPGD